MKIRKDFVTNSSSSSFIIAFENEEKLKKAIEEGIENISPTDFSWCNIGEDDFKKAVKDYAVQNIMNNVMDASEIIKIATDEFKSQARYKYYYCTKKFFEDENREYLDTDEYQTLEKEYVDNKLAELNAVLEKQTLLSLPYFSDNDGAMGCYLEHTLIPSLKETITSFNHH